MSVSAPVPTPRAAPTGAPLTSEHPDLHSVAVDAVTDLQALATGLHSMGADPGAIQSLVEMTNRLHQVATTLAHVPPQPNPAHASQAPEQSQGAAPQQAQAAPSAPQGGGSGPGSSQNVFNAAGKLHQAVLDSANGGGQ